MDATLYPSRTVLEDPIRDEIGMSTGFTLSCNLEERLPRISSIVSLEESG